MSYATALQKKLMVHETLPSQTTFTCSSAIKSAMETPKTMCECLYC